MRGKNPSMGKLTKSLMLNWKHVFLSSLWKLIYVYSGWSFCMWMFLHWWFDHLFGCALYFPCQIEIDWYWFVIGWIIRVMLWMLWSNLVLTCLWIRTIIVIWFWLMRWCVREIALLKILFGLCFDLKCECNKKSLGFKVLIPDKNSKWLPTY